MIRKILPVIFILFGQVAYAQHYTKCTVYSTYSDSSQYNGISLFQLYNNKGKVFFEKQYGEYRDNLFYDYSDTSKWDQLTYYIYLNDTLQIKKTMVYTDTHGKLDSNIHLVYYTDFNTSQQLIEIRSAWYSRANGCLPHFDGRWQDTSRTIYKYDQNDKLIEQYTQELSYSAKGISFEIYPNRLIYNYDDKSQLMLISGYKIASLDWYGFGETDTILACKEIYKYTKKGYTIIKEKYGYFGQTEEYSYTYDDLKRVIEEYSPTDYWDRFVRKVYGYYPDKRLEKELEYNLKGELKRTNIYTYE